MPSLNKNIIFIIVVIALNLTSFSFAQFNVSGRVLDINTKDGLERKDVFISIQDEDGDELIKSKLWYDEKRLKKKPKKWKKFVGSYKFKNIRMGKYKILIEENGYILHEESFNLYDMDIDKNFYVKSIEQLENEKNKEEIALKEKERKEQEIQEKKIAARKEQNIKRKNEEWKKTIFDNKINLLLGKDSIYKNLDVAILNQIKPELKLIYKKCNNELDKMFYSQFEYTKRGKYLRDEFDETTYKKWFNHYKKDYGVEWATSEAKRLATYPVYEKIKYMGNKIISIKETLGYEKPSWEEIVKFAGGYSKLAEKKINKKNTKSFTLYHELKSIEVLNKNKIRAKILLSGKDDAINFYNVIEKEKLIEGKMTIAKLDYFNMDKFAVNFKISPYKEISIPISQIDNNINSMLIEQKSIIKLMFDDIIEPNDLNHALKRSQNSSHLSRDAWVKSN